MLEVDIVSQARIDNALKRVQQSESPSKIAFSSYTHASFDQEQRITIGDIRWRTFADRAQTLNCQLFPLIWELQPPGVLNEVVFFLPNKVEIVKTRVRSGLSTMCWWCMVTGDVQDRLATTVFGRDKWLSARDFVQKQLTGAYPVMITDAVLDKLDQLKGLYDQVLSAALGRRLSEMSEGLYQTLARSLFGELADQFLVDRQSYFSSEIGDRISQRASDALRERQLEKIVKSLFLFDKGLFVGGEFGAPFMITFDRGIDTFIQSRIDIKSGKASEYGRNIAAEELADLLEEGMVRPTGALFDLFSLMAENELIVHDGNDYGNSNLAKRLIPDARAESVKLFPDDQDSFPPIEFTVRDWGVQKVVPTLASLHLWDIKPGLWAEKLKEASRTGQPQQVDVFKEVAKC